MVSRSSAPTEACAVAGILLLTACGEGAKAPRRLREAPAAVTLPERTGSSPVRFVDVTAEAGVHFEQVNGYGDGGWYYVEQLGTGVVFFDADGDRDPDLFFCNGARLVDGARGLAPRDAFFRNVGGGRFVDATAESGLGDARYSMAACAGDFDNDGDLDLYVTRFDEQNGLWRNDGTGRFTDVAVESGALGRPDGTEGACAFADVDGDGWLDLYVGGCLDHSRAKNLACSEFGLSNPKRRISRYCNPVQYPPLPDLLLRNRGDGTFEDFSRQSGIADLRARTLALAFFDFDDDGDQDLFVASDRSPNLLLRNDGAGRFTDCADEAGVAISSHGRPFAGMGATTGDFDGDGRIDLAATYYEREPNALYRNVGDGLFEDRAQPSGTGNPSFLSIGWGTELFDADLDGRLDWLVVNGHIQPHNDLLRPPGSFAGTTQLPLFFLNRGDGLFESLAAEGGPALETRLHARGLAIADFDGDGDLDVAISCNSSPARLWRNESPRGGNRWLAVRTVGAMRPGAAAGGSNRDGIGARVVVHLGERRLVREIRSAQSYLSQSDLPAHFGLGAAERVDLLEIRWPSGRVSRLEGIATDQFLEVEEPGSPER